jgi:hypothetical protein
MKRFGRFEFKAKKPAEVYRGDRLELGQGYVTIMRGGVGGIQEMEEAVAVIHLGQGQSVREITRPSSTRKR